MRIGLGIGTSYPRAGGSASKALTRNARVLFIGDSTTAGVGAGDGTGSAPEITNAYPLSVPSKAKDRLVALGIPSTAEALCADNNNGITHTLWNQYRPSVSVTSSLATSSRSPTLGGVGIRQGAGTALAFTPTVPVDTFEFWYPIASGFGVLAASIDGGAATTYNEANATDGISKGTISGLSLGTHTISFAVSSGTAHGPFIVNAFNSSGYKVHIFNAGARNWTSTDWQGATYPSSPKNALAAILPDIVVIDLGINDFRQAGTTIATFKSNVQALIDASVSAGARVILVVPHPIGAYSTTTDAWSQAAVLLAYQQLQASNSSTTTLIDAPALYYTAGLSGATNPATWAALNTAGNAYDTLHMKAAPYATEGSAVGDAIKTVLTAMGIYA